MFNYLRKKRNKVWPISEHVQNFCLNMYVSYMSEFVGGGGKEGREGSTDHRSSKSLTEPGGHRLS